MSLRFTDASGHRVNFGSAATLDNMTSFTWLQWFNPATLATSTNRELVGKLRTSDFLQGFACYQYTAAGVLEFDVSDASTYGRIHIASTNVWTTATWQLIAVTVSHGTSGLNDIYRGTLTANAVSVKDGVASTYAAPVSYDDSANSLVVAATTSSSTESLPADFSYFAIYPRVLTLSEIQQWQWQPQNLPNGRPVIFSALGWNGTGTQTDWSGSNNVGTISGSPTVVPNAPVRNPFAGQDWGPYKVTAVAGNPFFGMQQPMQHADGALLSW